METSKLRRQIAYEAARLMYERQESEYYRAKLKAARRFGRGWVKPADLPSNAEVRDQVQLLARLHEGDQRTADLQQMRLAALRMMRLLARFRPRLIGSVLTGHTRRGSDIDLHLFSDSLHAVTGVLEQEGMTYDVERKQVRKEGEQRVYRHIHVPQEHLFELTVYAADMAHHVFKSSITGKAIERVSIAELEQFLEREYPGVDIEQTLRDASEGIDRYQLYEVLLLPLENVRQHPVHHPEGDALYHSLQVFDLACNALPYDEEFLTAALLHDIGKGIDPADHVAAGLEAVAGIVTERPAWLIENHMQAHAIADGTIGWRRLRRLKESESFQELVLLGQCDRGGRRRGVEASDLYEAIAYLRELRAMCG
ncbi:Multifunctional CCA protein [Pirellulimonas nuda]|uniref:Multifunctional CCA protein n=1 Tax=Pirellulimonas nuda TaxID=2528009 RepID=A0A518DJ95_9BACT|nr:HD domain-containing protein [Pirellulimonas nuda]QDU91538.1 Multifunctional CCA protein [Pirellulimonas nuda]